MMAPMLDLRHKHMSLLIATLGLMKASQAAKPQASGNEAASIGKDEGSAGAGAAVIQTSVLVQLLGKQYSTQPDTGIETEVQNFLRETPPPLDCNPIMWWKVNGVKFREHFFILYSSSFLVFSQFISTAASDDGYLRRFYLFTK